VYEVPAEREELGRMPMSYFAGYDDVNFERKTADTAERGGLLDSPQSEPTTVMCVEFQERRKTEEVEEENSTS
jgi:hypothetical protein